MHSGPFVVPYSVYVETSAIVDLANTGSQRHGAANQLIRLFASHRKTQSLQLLTSTWAIAEAHGVLYELILQRSHISRPTKGGRPGNVRNVFPPRVAELQAADQQLMNLIQRLQSTVSFDIVPESGIDSNALLQLSRRIGLETAIWPNDSFHLAMAILSGCSMLITDDNGFMRRIDHCLATLIEPIRQQEFSQLGSALAPFRAHGLLRGRNRASAYYALRNLGF